MKRQTEEGGIVWAKIYAITNQLTNTEETRKEDDQVRFILSLLRPDYRQRRVSTQTAAKIPGEIHVRPPRRLARKLAAAPEIDQA